MERIRKVPADKSSCVGAGQVARWEGLMVTTTVYSGRNRLDGYSDVALRFL